MIKKILLTLVLLSILTAAAADPLSEKQALNKLAGAVNADGLAFNTTTEVKVYGYEFIAPTTVDGSAVTVTLAHRPAKADFWNLSDTYQVRLVKGGAVAGASTGIIIEPGQAVTFTDKEKIFSVWAADVADPGTFQISAAYEVGL